jgi:hypothetical protein
MISSSVINTPNEPAVKPTISVSALNTLDISFLLAPILFNMPISRVLAQSVNTRTEVKDTRRKEQRRSRPIEEKASYWWLEAMNTASSNAP